MIPIHCGGQSVRIPSLTIDGYQVMQGENRGRIAQVDGIERHEISAVRKLRDETRFLRVTTWWTSRKVFAIGIPS